MDRVTVRRSPGPDRPPAADADARASVRDTRIAAAESSGPGRRAVTSVPQLSATLLARVRSGLVENRWWNLLGRSVDLVTLTVCWIVASLGIVTSYAATTAMFVVVRNWHSGGSERVVASFVQACRENLKSATAAGLAWTGLGLAVAAETAVFARATMLPGRSIMVVPVVVTALLFVGASLWLFPVLANYDIPVRRVLATVLFLCMRAPFTTLLAATISAAAVGVILVVPVLVLAVPAVTAWLLQACQYRVFRTLKIHTGNDHILGQRPSHVTR